MILTENWVRNKLRYWSILHLSIYIIISVALITLIQDTHDEIHHEFTAIWTFIFAGFQLFLLFTEFCYLIGLSRRSMLLDYFLASCIHCLHWIDFNWGDYRVNHCYNRTRPRDEKMGYKLGHCNGLWFMWRHFNWVFVFVVLLYRTSNLDLNIERIDC
eukprot:08118.XXX_434903_434318_1 [CDS] Oithona nana genome sequencing.